MSWRVIRTALPTSRPNLRSPASRCPSGATTSSCPPSSPPAPPSRPRRKKRRRNSASGRSAVQSCGMRCSGWSPTSCSWITSRWAPRANFAMACGLSRPSTPIPGSSSACATSWMTPHPFVLATVGSGSDGYPVLAAAREALERLQATIPELCAILVTGPFMPAAQQAMLQARASAACRVVSGADTFELMAAADAVVSMGGYNSVCEALAVARPLMIVPRATHKVEQQIRAETLAARGLAWCIHPNDLSGPRLAEALEWALRCDRQAHARLVRQIIPSFDGAARLTAYLSRWLGGD